MVREAREVWEKRVRRLCESDLTDVEFAAELGVNINTLRAWKYKLGASKRSRSRRATQKKPTFVEMTAPASAVAAASDLEVIIHGARVRVPVGFDDATLARVLSILRQAR